MRLPTLLVSAALVACAPATIPPPKPNIDPAHRELPSTVPPPVPEAEAPEPMAPPEAAFEQGWMPLDATGVRTFLAAHPEWDGRGVLIGILDSGIDAGVPGLQRTPTGNPKLLDLRDFSGEGAVALIRVTPTEDSVHIAGLSLGGMRRVRLLTGNGPWYGGVLIERPLGGLPAADINGDGDDRDSLPVLVAQASDGWVLIADTDGDGSLAGERAVYDYLHARDTFGWAPAGRPSPITVAVNLKATGGVPDLDLYFDNSGHGTHVAGIAAGNDLYGVGGFDGVAPGAQLLGIKIANNAHDGVTVTGSMLLGIDYAIRFARARRMPLVLNLSFGVGNEREGAARIDAVIDSILAANPDVPFAISAGNDGPGLSTIGFPASADRALTVGGTLPLAFLEGAPTDGRPDPVAYFSSRGGELAKPDLLTPGVAYSSVPRWNTGDERKGGTSMASPHAAGLLALLRSAAVATKRAPSALQLKQALMVTARPLARATYLDQGTGVPDVGAAWAWLEAGHEVPEVLVRAEGTPGGSAAYQILGTRGDSTRTFELLRPAGVSPLAVTLRSDSPWLEAPATVSVGAGATRVTLRYRTGRQAPATTTVGVVSGWGPDTLAGPLFRLVNTLIVPAAPKAVVGPTSLGPGATARVFFPVDSGRPFAVRVAAAEGPTILGALFGPGGRPGLDENVQPAGPAAPAEFVIDASDATPGIWEADALASPVSTSSATVTLQASPVRLGLARDPQGVALGLTNLSGEAVTLQVGAALIGGQRGALIPGQGGREESLAFTMPSWARELVIDAAMPAAEWPRFTDFAFSVYDSAGRIVANQPLNYSDVRLRVAVPDSLAGRSVTLRLVPALTDSTDAGPWTLNVRIRAYAESPVSLDVAGSETEREIHLAPGAVGTVRFRLPDSPWPLPDGYVPLGQAVVLDGDLRWTREAGLPVPHPPPMR